VADLSYFPLIVVVLVVSCLILAWWLRDSTRQRSWTEGRATAIFDAAVDGIITIDENGCVETFNKAAEKIFGYLSREVVGQNIKVLMPEPYRAEHDGYLAAYKATGRAKIIGIGREVTGRRKDGSTFPMELAVGDSRRDGRRLYAGIVRDITERRRIEESLRQSEERFRLIVDNVRDYAITLLDTEGRIVSWNDGAQRLYQWTAEEAVGRGSESLYPDDMRGEAADSLRIVRDCGRYEGEGWRVRRDGSRFWAHSVITPLWDDQGKMRGFVRVSKDISDRRQAELALRAAKEEAESANLAKSKFLAAASHDLRQPVQALVFFTSALESRLSDGQGAPLLGEMRGSLDALNGLLGALLDVSRLDAGVIVPDEGNLALGPVLERLAAEVAPQIGEKKLRLRVVGCSAVIRTDAVLFGRMIQNLLSNAVKYTERGGILLGCRRRRGRLSVEVWDTGIGIPADRQEDIFEEFTQIGNSERDRSQGLGLGLAIVRRLSGLLDCPVSVTSIPGKGSKFAMLMPLVGFNQSRNITVLASAAGWRHGVKPVVLIIDDEVSVLKSLAFGITDWGYEVLSASGEDEALAVLAERAVPPDLIVADYRLRAGRTGAEAIRQIRRIFQRPIPSVIITGDTAPERIREAQQHGLNVLHKPVLPATLKAAIAAAVRS